MRARRWGECCHLQQPRFIGRSLQAPVETGKALLADFVGEPLFDITIGSRAEIERHKLGGSLAQSMGQVFAGDDEIAPGVVPRVLSFGQPRGQRE
jgi:hypothetical protein